jgi:DNA-binding NtrC family response regulator
MGVLFEATTCDLLAELVQGPVCWCTEEGSILYKAGFAEGTAATLEKQIGSLVRKNKPKNRQQKIHTVFEAGMNFVLFFIERHVLILSHQRRQQEKDIFRSIIEEALPYIAQVAGGDAVLFDSSGVRFKAVHADGTPNEDAVGLSNELCRTVMREGRPSMGPSSLSPGATAVRIPLSIEYGLAFNNTFASRQRQRLLNSARQYGYARYHMEDIIGDSLTMTQAKAMAVKAAKTDTTILLTGETGTGKELFAQSIHNLSDRAARPFVAVNCGAVPGELVESTLFGYVAGAFTGANRAGQAGCFEQADSGTIFLDEISEMPYSVQVKLLRVLQEREIIRVGEGVPRPVDVKIIASSNKSLKTLVRDGKFRPDLYYRLSIFEINIPPLRERTDDIVALVDYYMQKYASMFGKAIHDIHPETMRALTSYNWPGNIRELRNCMEYVFNIVEKTSTSITPDLLPANIIPEGRGPQPAVSLYDEHMRQTEREIVLRALRFCGNNQSEAAKRLGINRTTLWRIVKKNGLLSEKRDLLLQK